jgi:predicted membrane chloride channel (bestrophin family)
MFLFLFLVCLTSAHGALINMTLNINNTFYIIQCLPIRVMLNGFRNNASKYKIEKRDKESKISTM